MENIKKRVLFGNIIEETKYEATEYEPRIIFCDRSMQHSFAIDEPTVFKNLLLLGSAGSGKTNVLNQIVAQTRAWCNSENKDGISLIFVGNCETR